MKNILIVIWCLIPILNTISFIGGLPNELYYGVFLISSVYFLLINNRYFVVRFEYFCFYFFSVLSLVFSEKGGVFNAELRWLLFFIVTSVVGPLFLSDSLHKFRIKVFYIVNISILAVVVSSFFYKILGFSLADELFFMGIVNHSMLMGPMAAISLVILYSNFLERKSYSLLLISLPCFFVLLMASSRSSILALFVSLFFMTMKKYSFNILYVIKPFLIVFFLLFSSQNYWVPYTEGILKKMDYAESQEDLAASRSSIWQERVDEFLKSPFLGSGFATISADNISTKTKDNGVIEPGSGWLFLLSSLGFFGFISFILPFIIDLFRVFGSSITGNYVYVLLGLSIFFVIHLLFEGYITASGSFLFFYFWLLLSLLNSFKFLNYKCKQL